MMELLAKYVPIKKTIQIVIMPAINWMYMLFPFPAANCNVRNCTINDSHSIGHRMSYWDETTIPTETLLIPSPLYVHVIHVFDAVGQMVTLVNYQPCQFMMISKKRL